MNIKKWLTINTNDLTGKTIAITGSTGGLGTEVVKILAGLNANLILLNRNKHDSLLQTNQLQLLNSKIKIETIQIDMEDFDSVKSACEIISNKQIDYLILNAGAYAIPKRKTSLRLNNVFQINFFSQYYIVKQLLPMLRKSKSKVIAVGSIAHNYSKIDTNDVDFSTRTKASKIYGNSKRFLMFALSELLKNEKDIQFSIAHPGITFTNITRHYPKWIWWLIKYPMKVIFHSPKTASLSIVLSLFKTTDYMTWIGPKFFNIWGKPKIKKLSTCPEKERKQIFEISEKIYENIIKI